jgi:hypothetical protein
VEETAVPLVFRPSFRSLVLAPALALLACEPELGECTGERQMEAFEIVYTAEGTPAYAGQALINQSCGGGGFCHSENIDAQDRVGAPAGLSFDLNLASVTSDLNESAVMRLERAQEDTFAHRVAVLDQVQRGLMPPQGEESMNVLASLSTYDRVSDDGTTFTPLPAIDTEEGQEILRTWLACGTPVIERTQARLDGENGIGSTVPTCERRCVDPTWPNIVEQIFMPSCALSRCHDSDAPAAQLDMSVADPGDPAQLAALHEALLDPGYTAGGTLCAASAVSDVPMFVAGDAEGSLMFQKVRSDLLSCGSLMPLSGSALNEQRLCALEAWINCGACVDPEDEACAACVAEERAGCGVQIGASGVPECVEQVACPRFAPSPSDM